MKHSQDEKVDKVFDDDMRKALEGLASADTLGEAIANVAFIQTCRFTLNILDSLAKMPDHLLRTALVEFRGEIQGAVDKESSK